MGVASEAGPTLPVLAAVLPAPESQDCPAKALPAVVGAEGWLEEAASGRLVAQSGRRPR